MNFLAVAGWLHCFASVPSAVATLWPPTHTEITTAVAALLVGIVVGMTGMGGGALMTPALIFLGVGQVSSIVTADQTAAAIYKSSGACVHWREGVGRDEVRMVSFECRMDDALQICPCEGRMLSFECRSDQPSFLRAVFREATVIATS